MPTPRPAWQRWLLAAAFLAGGAGGLVALLQIVGLWLETHWQLGPAPWDQLLLDWCRDHYHLRLHRWAADFSALGSPPVLTLLVASVVVALLLGGRRHLAAWVLITSLGASLLVTGVKDMVERPRPPAPQRLDPFVGDSFSFPSGHSLGAMAIYAYLGLLLARLAPTRAAARFVLASSLALPIVIGLTRIYLRVHYPTDVLAGWLAGLAWVGLAALAARFVEPAGRSDSATSLLACER